MSPLDLEHSLGRAAARLGVVAALTVGAAGVGTASADPAQPVPPPPPPGAPAAAPAAPPAPPPGAPAPPPGAPAPPPGAVPVGFPAPPTPVPPVPPGPWDGIAQCEAGGNWHADTGNGRHGGLQLNPRTWAAYGGGEFAPQADRASREQQIVVGDRVRAEQGWDAWSGCADGIAPG